MLYLDESKPQRNIQIYTTSTLINRSNLYAFHVNQISQIHLHIASKETVENYTKANIRGETGESCHQCGASK